MRLPEPWREEAGMSLTSDDGEFLNLRDVEMVKGISDQVLCLFILTYVI